MPIKILNLYLIKPLYFEKEGITLSELNQAWLEFSENNKKNLFKNPPINEWIDTKENWCKKLAAKVSEQFNWPFDEALSEVYYTVMKCYSKGHVYMGNLGYIQTAVYNNVRMTIRFNKNRLNQDSGNCDSLDKTIMTTDDGETISIKDLLGYEDNTLKQMEYKDFEKEARTLLEESFSKREIDQILTQKAGYLPMNLYKRLNTWRKKHSADEIMQ